MNKKKTNYVWVTRIKHLYTLYGPKIFVPPAGLPNQGIKKRSCHGQLKLSAKIVLIVCLFTMLGVSTWGF